MNTIKKVALIFIFSTFATHLWALERQDWQSWLDQVKQEAIAQGIREGFVEQIFAGMTPDKRVINLNRTQPEKRLTFLQYRQTRIDSYRILLGIKQYQRYRKLLENIAHHYQTDPCIITALWGMETSYGYYLGSFSVIRSLATLAYTDTKRSNFFRKELMIALHILNEGHVDLSNFKGEWAGASGQPQFLPSSWQRYAVDYNQDSHKNIWEDKTDAFASMANYLAMNGWQEGMPLLIQVDLPPNFSSSFFGYNQTKSVTDWMLLGVRPTYGQVQPAQDLPAWIIATQGGPVFMVFKNFRVLLTYNNSNYYAASVAYLAQKICKEVHNEYDVAF